MHRSVESFLLIPFSPHSFFYTVVAAGNHTVQLAERELGLNHCGEKEMLSIMNPPRQISLLSPRSSLRRMKCALLRPALTLISALWQSSCETSDESALQWEISSVYRNPSKTVARQAAQCVTNGASRCALARGSCVNVFVPTRFCIKPENNPTSLMMNSNVEDSPRLLPVRELRSFSNSGL